jgi:flagellar hook assembly protein FlgD
MPGWVALTVYNALGQQVKQFDLGRKNRGTHEFVFDGSGLPSGVYFYRVDAGVAAATGRMVLMK